MADLGVIESRTPFAEDHGEMMSTHEHERFQRIWERIVNKIQEKQARGEWPGKSKRQRQAEQRRAANTAGTADVDGEEQAWMASAAWCLEGAPC